LSSFGRKFLNPAVVQLESVGSRDVELEVEQLKRAGCSVIPVYGFPLVTLPPEVAEIAGKAAASNHSAPSNGLQELRQALGEIIQTTYGAAPDIDREILITNGGMHGLHVVMTALLEPKDEVLLVTPCYFFGGLVKLTGAKVVTVPAHERDGYRPDFGRIRRHVTSNTKAVVMSSPVNPTGYVYSRDDVEAFISLAEEHDLLLISDESYDRLLYDGLAHISPFHYQQARKRTILVKSFTKSYALPNLRIGYVVANAELCSSFRKVLEWTVLHCPYVNQKVALAVLQGPQEWLKIITCELGKRRNELIHGIRDSGFFSCATPRGGPFVFLNVSQAGGDCSEVASRLLQEFGVPAVSGKYFHDRDHIRIPFAGSSEAVSQLVRALQLAARKYRQVDTPVAVRVDSHDGTVKEH
jgi:aminotransferase